MSIILEKEQCVSLASFFKFYSYRKSFPGNCGKINRDPLLRLAAVLYNEQELTLTLFEGWDDKSQNYVEFCARPVIDLSVPALMQPF